MDFQTDIQWDRREGPSKEIFPRAGRRRSVPNTGRSTFRFLPTTGSDTWPSVAYAFVFSGQMINNRLELSSNGNS